MEKQDYRRSISYALASWGVIALTVAVSIHSPIWLYPIAVLIIANRQLALSFLAHEGVHGNLFSHAWINDVWARYLCAFPLFISLSRYRQLHLMHHRFLGTKSDPDLQFYDFYPQTKRQLAWTFFGSWAAGGTAVLYANYFNDAGGFLRGRFMALVNPQSLKWRMPKEFKRLDDRWAFLAFWILVIAAVILTNFYLWFAMYWLVPLYFYIFYFRFTGGLQHGMIFSEAEPQSRSRSIPGGAVLMELLLPCGINYHQEHHDNPKVPYFNLRKLHLQKQRPAPGYIETVRSLVKS